MIITQIGFPEEGILQGFTLLPITNVVSQDAAPLYNIHNMESFLNSSPYKIILSISILWKCDLITFVH